MHKRNAIIVMDGFIYDMPDGKKSDRVVYGGGERYTIELWRLLKDLDFEVNLIQWTQPKARLQDGTAIGSDGWTKAVADIDGMVIQGVACQHSEYTRNLYYMTEGYDLVIYLTMPLAYPMARRHSISISHGIPFDDLQSHLPVEELRGFWQPWLEAALAVDRVVTVDVNTMNVFGAVFNQRARHKFEHIPNFVDCNVFKPKEHKSTEKLWVKQVRRLEPQRGVTLGQALAERLTDKHSNLHYEFVGRAFSEKREEAFKQWCSEHERVTHRFVKFDGIERIYQDADISVIPTFGAEGTSLTALESMACGCAVVASNVGGLAELIIDGYNGLLVNPTVEAFEQACDYLIAHPEQRKLFGERARQVAEARDITIWRDKWSRVIEEVARK